MVRPDLCDFIDAYIVVEGTITVRDPNNDAYDEKLASKNNTSFDSCTLKINNTLIDNAEDLDIVMYIMYIVIVMYNWIEHSKNYSKAAWIFWNYYRDEPNSGLGGAYNNINYSIKDSKYFDYKTSITGKIEGSNIRKEVKIVVSLKHFRNFWRILDQPLINCEINLILTWSENWLIAKIENPKIDNPTNATFKITDTTLYAPVVTLSRL